VAQEDAPLLGLLADDPRPRRLPGVDGLRELPAVAAGRDGVRDRLERRHWTEDLEAQRGADRVNANNGRQRWSFKGDDEINTSAAYWKGTIYIASDGGTLYALNARTGKLRWSATSNSKFGSREFFYASPAVAYGRVYIGNTDGTMYVYGAKTGKLRWARPLGSYIYSGAALWKRRVFVGTYDGSFYALDAATGDVIWKKSAPSAVHAPPTVMNGLVYFSVCSSCGQAAQRAVKHGPDGTYALSARTGRVVWRFRAGKFANPVVADSRRIYVTGRANLFALKPRR
jgi:outer membrane protein assembly factor BamB